ncbi:MAG: ABC transporter permease [Actinobacteria bacterium]|nr:ABC transporter permease [Actinomycetota bacterium]
MKRYIARRLLWLIPTLLLVTFLVYVALRLGTNPVESYKRANARASKKKIQQYIELNGLYDGAFGYVRGYFKWLGGFLTGDWAPSIKGRTPVWPNLKDALANSLRLGVTASIVGIFVGNLFGVLAALRPGRLRDTAVNTGALIGLAIPPFVSALLLQLLFSIYWQKWFGYSLFPTSGVYPPGHQGFDLALMLKHMALPVVVVAIQTIASYSRYMRSSLLDVLNSDYLRTARSKGISERQVLLKHSLRNALIPVTTLIFLDIGAIVGGLIITEGLFEYPGMGRFFLVAYGNGDFPQLMPFMVIIVGSVVVFNLLADIVYARLDPRIKLV